MARNIYFAGSIRAGRADVDIYAHIVKLLKKYGTVLTEHVADSRIDENGKFHFRYNTNLERVSKGKEHEDDKYIHDRDMAWLEKSEGWCCACMEYAGRRVSIIGYAVIVAEVTQPSLGVGYEIGRAVDLNKTILCLFRPETGKRMLFV